MVKQIKAQFNILIRQNGAISCFLIILFCVSCNYLQCIYCYRHWDKAVDSNFLFNSILAENNDFGWYILTFLPFLVVLPGGLSLAKEKRTSIDIHLISRCGGRKKYYLSKTIAVFMVTFCCFAIPLLIELILNLCAFPIESSRDWISVDMVYEKIQGGCSSFYLFGLFYLHPVQYALFRIGVTGGLMGLLSLIPVACSCVYSKYYAYLLVPVYFLLSFFSETTFTVFGHKITHNYMSYFSWGDCGIDNRQLILFSILILIMGIISLLCIFVHAAKGGD